MFCKWQCIKKINLVKCMPKKTVSTWEVFSKASDFVFQAIWIQFYYIFMYKADTVCSWWCQSLHVIYYCKGVFNMTQRNEHCPIISDLIKPYMKNKTVEKAKHKTQNYYGNRREQYLICKVIWITSTFSSQT